MIPDIQTPQYKLCFVSTNSHYCITSFDIRVSNAAVWMLCYNDIFPVHGIYVYSPLNIILCFNTKLRFQFVSKAVNELETL
jgi:hypothetical protein